MASNRNIFSGQPSLDNGLAAVTHTDAALTCSASAACLTSPMATRSRLACPTQRRTPSHAIRLTPSTTLARLAGLSAVGANGCYRTSKHAS